MLSLPPLSFAAFTSAAAVLSGWPACSVGDPAHGRRRDKVRQSVAAEQERGIRLPGGFEDIDEVSVAGFVLFGSDVAVDLVATRMLHRLCLGDFARVLALADW